MSGHRTTIDVDDDILQQARSILGTRGIKDTIDAALQDVIVRDARRQVIAHLKSLDIDPDQLRAEAWGP